VNTDLSTRPARTATADRIGLLPTGVAKRHLNRAVLAGAEPPAQVALLRASAPVDDASARWNSEPVRVLLEQAMARFEGDRAAADAWLAPRLHATLRLTRGEAANKDLWAYLGLIVAPDYVIWRHRPVVADEERRTPTVQSARFVGGNNSQALARLWWAAELFRDGADYAPAEFACGNQDVLNTALRLDIMEHRPTAQAVLRVVRRLADAGTPRLGDHVNALTTAVRVARSTLVFEALGPDELPDEAGLLDWVADADSAPPVSWDRLPDGPDDGGVPAASVATLTALFEDINTHLARARDRRSSAA